ncbi:MAG TPA: hypothetical protein VGI66_03415 [Streptosporangiaceae bacterium]
MSPRRLVADLLSRNPGLTVREPGGSSGNHWKLYMGGRLVGILPMSFKGGQMDGNLRSQLRRAGIAGRY